MGIDSLFGNGIDGKTSDIIKALGVISNELNKLKKGEKEKFDKIMMTGNGQMGGFLSASLVSIGIPMILNALMGSGLHNMPAGTKGYIEHRKKIPIPKNSQPLVKQPEGTALINKKWEPYNSPPFYNEHEIKGYEVKNKRSKKRTEEGILFRNSKNNPVKKVPLLNILC